MPKLTDDELGELLRETFADHEHLLDDSFEPAGRRGRLPILLAAAAVLAILGGVLYGVGRAEPDPPVATPAVSEHGEIWGAAVAAITRSVDPAGSWQVIHVIGQYADGSDVMTKSAAARPVTFSAADKAGIERAVGSVAPVDWSAPDEVCTGAQVSTVVLGPVVDKAGHKEVATSIRYHCGRGKVLTYRLEKTADGWRVDGTVGAVSSVMPAGGCPLTNPESGC
ncbi:hypothetical protein [Kribbella sp. NPDC048915]|uniref:hypothetical protein n=1 Tax=Kribbella sp. NPDC048915 TaxID=3155148 RepID=UPI003402A736